MKRGHIFLAVGIILLALFFISDNHGADMFTGYVSMITGGFQMPSNLQLFHADSSLKPVSNTRLPADVSNDQEVTVSGSSQDSGEKVQIKSCEKDSDCGSTDFVTDGDKVKQTFCNYEGVCAERSFSKDFPDEARPPCIFDAECGYHEACVNLGSNSYPFAGKCEEVECNENIPCLEGSVCLKTQQTIEIDGGTKIIEPYHCAKVCSRGESEGCVPQSRLSEEEKNLNPLMLAMKKEAAQLRRMLAYYKYGSHESAAQKPIWQIPNGYLDKFKKVSDSGDLDKEDTNYRAENSRQQLTETAVQKSTFEGVKIAPSAFMNIAGHVIYGLWLGPQGPLDNSAKTVSDINFARSNGVPATNNDEEGSEDTQSNSQDWLVGESNKNAIVPLWTLIGEKLHLFDFIIQSAQDEICDVSAEKDVDYKELACDTTVYRSLDENIKPYGIYYKDLLDNKIKLAGVINGKDANDLLTLVFDKDNKLKLRVGILPSNQGKFYTAWFLNDNSVTGYWKIEDLEFKSLGDEPKKSEASEIKKAVRGGATTNIGADSQDVEVYINTNTGERLAVKKPSYYGQNRKFRLKVYNPPNDKVSNLEIDLRDVALGQVSGYLSGLSNSLHIKSDIDALLKVDNEYKIVKEIWISRELPVKVKNYAEDQQAQSTNKAEMAQESVSRVNRVGSFLMGLFGSSSGESPVSTDEAKRDTARNPEDYRI